MEDQIGSAPIEEKHRAMMNAIAHSLDDVLNPGLSGNARNVGFVLLVFEYGEKDGRCNYISNGADRADIIKLLREQADRFDTGAM